MGLMVHKLARYDNKEITKWCTSCSWLNETVVIVVGVYFVVFVLTTKWYVNNGREMCTACLPSSFSRDDRG